MADTAQADGASPSRSSFRRYLWNAKVRLALIITLPSILTFLSGQLIAQLIDRELDGVRARNAVITADITVLDSATRNFEVFELLRASFLLDIAASGGDAQTAFQLDQFHRESALTRLREVAATLDPGTWKDRLKDYEATVMTDYRVDDNAGKKRLQETENAIIAEAKRRLTEDQMALIGARNRIDVLEARKHWWTTVLGYLGNLLSVLVFFIKVNVPSSAA